MNLKLILIVTASVLIFIAFFGGIKWHSSELKSNAEETQALALSNVSAGSEKAGLEKSGTEKIVSPPVKSRRSLIVDAAEDAYPAVVFIGVTQIRIVSPFINDPFFRQFFPPTYKKYQSMGSGVVVDKSGIIVTNYHVIEDASELQVTLCDGRHFNAEVLCSDKWVDLAVLKINGTGLPVIKMGTSNDLMIGEWAIAIGNPFGEMIQDSKSSVTLGVISALQRDFKLNSFQHGNISYKGMIQTDASINPGNSGGALVNCLGELIGINTFIFTKNQGGSVGVGFAIPVERVKRILAEVKIHGRIRPFWTGISVQDLSAMLVQTLRLDRETRGVIITEIIEKSPAEKAGLKVGDIITNVNNHKVFSREDIQDIFNDFYADEVITVSIIRKAESIQRNMKLEEKKSK
ncbi:MAG: trypsin-like peptidase domain-containing protein [bacterium]